MNREKLKQALREAKSKKIDHFNEFRNVMLIAVDFCYLCDVEKEIQKAYDKFATEAKEQWRIIDWLEQQAPFSKKDELLWVVSERGKKILELEQKIQSICAKGVF